MNETLEYQGFWWLPGADGDKVPGLLKFEPDDGSTLDLLGSLKGLKGVIDPLEPEIILGLSSDGKLITLADCRKTSGNLAFGSGFSTSTFAVNTIFAGEHFWRAEDIEFERLQVEYLHLGAWAHSSVFEMEMIDQPDVQPFTVRHKIAEPMTATVKDGYEVILYFGSYREWSRLPVTWVNITQPAELVIRFPEKEPFDRLSDIVFRLQHLLSLGTRRSVYPVAVRGYTGPVGEARQVDVSYRTLGRSGISQERPELYEMLFSRRSLPGGFGPAVASWLEGAEKLDPVYRLFLGTVYNPSAFIEQQFLSLVTALEVYHRRAVSTPQPPEKHDKRKREILEAVPADHRYWLERELKFSHEPTLEARLHEIFRKNLEITQAVVGRKKKARADFIQEVVNARNYRAHFDERLEGRAARGVKLHPINQKLTLLLEGCLTAEIGFEADEIKNAILGVR